MAIPRTTQGIFLPSLPLGILRYPDLTLLSFPLPPPYPVRLGTVNSHSTQLNHTSHPCLSYSTSICPQGRDPHPTLLIQLLAGGQPCCSELGPLFI